MPPTYSARIDEEKVEELKEQSGADADSEAIRAAVEFALYESRKMQFRLVMGMFLLLMGASKYFTVEIDPSFAPVALIAGIVLLEYPSVRRLVERGSSFIRG
ncbi:hypothetical protein IL252_11235 [Halomicrobium sp. IBSBa]|uniref:hypothetical protein n=1 Tax=unclassified Halomicrobium TaxID=2610901 RepID=UPI001ABF5D91|nr:hypothetical protein [Halomicrobium sp. IBSBa]MBO4248387.1 hypothetical protein [Halomicrobium sp. IBSBa]